MFRFNRFICCILCFFFACGLALASDPVADKFMSAANDEYSEQNYAKAYEYINSVLDLYRNSDLPENAVVLAETIYHAYLGELRQNNKQDELAVMKVWLKEFPNVNSSRIKALMALFENDIAQKAEKAKVSSDNNQWQKELEAERKERQNEREFSQNMLNTFTSQLESQTESFQEAIQSSSKKSESISKIILFIVLGIGSILVLLFIIVLINVAINAKNAKRQQDQFAATLQVVASMNRIPSERFMLDGVVDVYGDSQLRLVGSSSSNTNSLPEPEVDEKEFQQIREFAVQCERIGNEIDVMTGRKNNSKNISELVYKICMEMGIKKNIAMLYFCAAMTYDIGFLNMEKDLLQAENLTEEEKYKIRSHVKPDSNAFDFIPEKYRSVFTEATAMHHENMDGSGYPAGLKGNEISQIARIIHVVETFVSLISRRNYRAIFDKESAILELRKHPELYDLEIIDVLDSIV